MFYIAVLVAIIIVFIWLFIANTSPSKTQSSVENYASGGNCLNIYPYHEKNISMYEGYMLDNMTSGGSAVLRFI